MNIVPKRNAVIPNARIIAPMICSFPFPIISTVPIIVVNPSQRDIAAKK
jgi:hypothetical protein